MKFLTYSIGLNAFPKNASSVLAQPRMTKVEVSLSRNPADPTNAFKLQAVSGHNLAEKPGGGGVYTMSEEDYQNCPQTA